jgi:hypothetical protein
MIDQSMIPSICLHLAGSFLTYFLQVAVAYGVCLLLCRLLRKPQQRFLLWLCFLLGSGTYWLGLIWSEIRLFSVAPGESNAPPAGAVHNWLHPFLIPPSWSHSIVVGGQLLAPGYLAAVFLLLGLAGWRHLQLRLVLRRGIEPSEALDRLFRATCRDFKVPRSRLLVLPGLQSPATACWWRPRVLLPEVCEELGPTPQLADVLYHELVHVSRRDYLWAGISDLICRLLFFHPAAWQARKRMQLEGELACDMTVVEARPGQRVDYADSLAYFVRLRMLQEGTSVGVDFAASASTLGIRIRTILAPPEPLPWWKRTSQMLAAMTLVSATALLLPMVNILLDFARPNLAEAASLAQVPPRAPVRHRSIRRTHSKANAAPASSPQDSLTNLRVQPLVRETPAYTLTATANSRPDAAPGDMDKIAWNESSQPVRTVSSVVLTTIRQIPAGIPRGRDRDHDHDDH